MNHLFLFLLLFHTFGDFYLQSNKVSQSKCNSFWFMIWHCAVYSVSILIPLYMLGYLPFTLAAGAAVSLGILHFVIDRLKQMITRRRKEPHFALLFFVLDQTLHIGCLFLLCLWARPFTLSTPWFYSIPDGTLFLKSVQLLTALLIGSMPAAITVKLVLALIQKPEKEKTIADITIKQEEDAEAGGGRLIGILERATIIILAFCQQFGAIGFVLTAKSIARYKQLEKQSFAEKYIVGTLTSTLIALCISLLVAKL